MNKVSEHASGSGSTGVSITTSYVTGDTQGFGLKSVVYPFVHRLPLPQSHTDVFQLLPCRIKQTPCPINTLALIP